MLLLPITTSLDFTPTNVKRSAFTSAVTVSEYFPLISESVPVVVPLTTIETPGNGALSAPVTVPVMVLCAKTKPVLTIKTISARRNLPAPDKTESLQFLNVCCLFIRLIDFGLILIMNYSVRIIRSSEDALT